MKPDAALWVATKALLWPWKRGSFRGWSVEAGEALGYVPGTLRAWDQKSSRGIGKPAIDRIATLLESRAAQSSELARAWRAHAATLPDNYPVPWFRKSRLLEKDGWRSKPRK
jgi:hypothetical protein